MKFSVEQILDLPDMKILGCQKVEGMGLVIEIEADVNFSTCDSCGQVSRNIHQNQGANNSRFILGCTTSTLKNQSPPIYV